jgi:hypothetical protein
MKREVEERCKEARSLNLQLNEGMEIEGSEDKLNIPAKLNAKEEKKGRVNDQKMLRNEEGKN